jgi:hypothetical protein
MLHGWRAAPDYFFGGHLSAQSTSAQRLPHLVQRSRSANRERSPGGAQEAVKPTVTGDLLDVLAGDGPNDKYDQEPCAGGDVAENCSHTAENAKNFMNWIV